MFAQLAGSFSGMHLADSPEGKEGERACAHKVPEFSRGCANRIPSLQRQARLCQANTARWYCSSRLGSHWLTTLRVLHRRRKSAGHVTVVDEEGEDSLDIT